jgi:16S rRNA (cytosine1402-N4)-methyltransferase|tara:strand:- start:556 stop:1569 length:1014 start_codon:yes stop_codon:yes gene_type:complete
MNVPLSSLEISHFPVMLNEIIKVCSPEKGGNFIDCTFGGGGYSEALLNFPKTNVIALDRDIHVKKKAEFLKKKFLDRFSFYNEKFSNLDQVANNKKIDAIIFDLGVSSFQLLDMERGFSFKSKAKIDMSMGLTNVSAEHILNNYDQESLKSIIRVFGDEKEASKITKNIIKFRKNKKISKVSELVEIITKSKKKNYSKKINVCTKTFQAIRIFVNKEITELVEGIDKATQVIKPGGKIIIVSFHSIEDKIAKFYFNNYSKNRSKPSRYLPEEKLISNIYFENYRNDILQPSQKEIQINNASRSAKLRFAIRNNNQFTSSKDLRVKFKKYLDLENVEN